MYIIFLYFYFVENKHLKIIELNGFRFNINTEEIRLLKILRRYVYYFFYFREFLFINIFFFNLIISDEIISGVPTSTQSGTRVIFDIRSISREQSV